MGDPLVDPHWNITPNAERVLTRLFGRSEFSMSADLMGLFPHLQYVVVSAEDIKADATETSNYQVALWEPGSTSPRVL